MGKVSISKLNEYKKFNSNQEVNKGFEVNINKLLYGYSNRSEYPELKNIILETDSMQLAIEIYYYKFSNKTGAYIMRAYESKIEGKMLVSGTAYFSKDYYKSTTPKGERFAFKKLVEIVSNIQIDSFKEEVLRDFEAYKKLRSTGKVGLGLFDSNMAL